MKQALKQSTIIFILNAVSVAALLFMVFSLFCYSNVIGKLNKANDDRFELTENANRFMNGSSYLTNEVRAYAVTGDQKHYNNYWNEINNLKNREIGVENMKKIGITSEEEKMIAQMSELSNNLVPLEENAMNDVAAGDREEALEYVYGKEYSDSITKINELKSSFLKELDDRAVTEVNRLVGVTKIIRFFLYLSVVVIGVLQVLTSFVTRKKIILPIITIQGEMEEIAGGNLSGEFALVSDTSEIGRLTEAIHVTKKELKNYISDIDRTLAQMAEGNMDLVIGNDYCGEFLPIQNALRMILESLNRVLSEINESSDQVAAGSEQIATSAQELSRGTTEQSATVLELSNNVKILSDKMETMTANAANARDCTVDASRQVEISNNKMEELAEAIDKIAQASEQIGGIIKMIEDIAFQTNILALNAAVEAARAGEAGKGFAVVADEVRNLAAKSSEAAQDTSALIENMLQFMKLGTELTTETRNALLGVVGGSQHSTELVDEIAAVAKEQMDSLDQVRMGIQQISCVVESNAALAEESAASASELSGQATVLKDSVHRFKLRR